MKRSTIDRKYTKRELASLLDVEEEAYSKAQLVDMFMNPSPKSESTLATDDSALGITMKEKAEADLDNALEVILKEGILYRVDSHCWWGKTSRVPEDQVKAPKEILSGVKTLIDPEHLQPFRAWKGQGERIIKKLGYQFLGLRGVYFVPKGWIQDVEAILLGCKEKAEEEKKIFIDNFVTYKAEWRDRVLEICDDKGIAYEVALAYLDEDNYPSKAGLDAKFVFKWTKFAITVPNSDMGILTDKEYKEEVRKQKVQAKEFLDNCLAELAQKFYSIISSINDKLLKGDVIKPKTLGSLESFTEIFDKMNITNNVQLAGYVEEARKLFNGVAVADLKENEFSNKLSDELDSVVSRFKTESNQELLRDIEF
jgi:hypothetical protein